MYTAPNVLFQFTEDEVEEQDSDDEYDDNWPPWVTSPTEDEDVKVVDPNDIYGHRGEPRKTSGAAAPTSRSTLTGERLLLS